MKKLLYVAGALATTLSQAIALAPSQEAPYGLSAEQVPQFVVLSFDDNGLTGHPETGEYGGMQWVVDTFEKYKNQGSGIKGTFDNDQFKTTFYLLCTYASDGAYTTPEHALSTWFGAMNAGHELGNHTWNHPYGKSLSLAQWEKEIAECEQFLSDKFGASKNGFRASNLSFNQGMHAWLADLEYRHDSSVSEGWQPWISGDAYFWPHDSGYQSPTFSFLQKYYPQYYAERALTPGVMSVPPAPLIVPPDSEMTRFGLSGSLREKISANTVEPEYFEIETGKIPGLDTSLFIDAEVTGDEALAILIYSYEQHSNGNRAPFVYVAHSDVYHPRYDVAHNPVTSATERQAAMEGFLSYLSTRPEARVVSTNQLLDWLESPVTLAGEPVEVPDYRPTDGGVFYSGCDADIWQSQATYPAAYRVSWQGATYQAKWYQADAEPGKHSVWYKVDQCAEKRMAPAATPEGLAQNGFVAKESGISLAPGFARWTLDTGSGGLVTAPTSPALRIGSVEQFEVQAKDGYQLRAAWFNGQPVIVTRSEIEGTLRMHIEVTIGEGENILATRFEAVPTNTCGAPYWHQGQVYQSGERVRFNGHEWQALMWNINKQPNGLDKTLWLDIGACK